MEVTGLWVPGIPAAGLSAAFVLAPWRPRQLPRYRASGWPGRRHLADLQLPLTRSASGVTAVLPDEAQLPSFLAALMAVFHQPGRMRQRALVT